MYQSLPNLFCPKQELFFEALIFGYFLPYTGLVEVSCKKLKSLDQRFGFDDSGIAHKNKN